MVVEPVRMMRSAVERSLPKAAYIGEAHFEVERERIFWRDWFCVGRTEQVRAAGDYLHVDVAGERILVVRTRRGSISAHYDVCRHRGSRLALDAPVPESCDFPAASGRFKGVIRCPYHSWTYELDGRVRNAPFLGERDDFYPEEFGLHPVDVDEWAGWLFVRLVRPAPGEPERTLADQLGPVPERVRRYPLADLRAARRIVYEVAANWKVILENYNECYHCAGVHPELCRIVPAFRKHFGSDLDWDDGVPQAEGTFTFTMTGVSDREPFPGDHRTGVELGRDLVDGDPGLLVGGGQHRPMDGQPGHPPAAVPGQQAGMDVHRPPAKGREVRRAQELVVARQQGEVAAGIGQGLADGAITGRRVGKSRRGHDA